MNFLIENRIEFILFLKLFMIIKVLQFRFYATMGPTKFNDDDRIRLKSSFDEMGPILKLSGKLKC